VVIGGGPAGSSAARSLARHGWRTVLIERGPRHRPKACGTCLNPRAAELLRRAGLLDDVRNLAVGATHRLRVHLVGRPPLAAVLPHCDEAGGGLLVPRDGLDQLLIDRAAEAGVQVVQPAVARIVELTSHRAVIELRDGSSTTHLRPRLVVGADGLRSAVAEAAGLARPGRAGRKFGFSFQVTTPAAGAVDPDTIEMFLVSGGYLGVVAHGGKTLHVAGLVAARGNAPSNPLDFVEWVANRFDLTKRAGLHRLRRSGCSRLLGAGPIPCRPHPVADERVVLVGDAAGYTEPFSGEGISWALECAEILADSVAEHSPGHWTACTVRRYRRLWKRRVGRRQHLGRLLAGALERPGLTRALLDAVTRHRAIADWLVRRAVMP
jgi:flavin-dependent dehydrogenase